MYYVERDWWGFLRRVETLREKLGRKDLRIDEARRVTGYPWDYEVPVEGTWWYAGLSEAEYSRLTRRRRRGTDRA